MGGTRGGESDCGLLDRIGVIFLSTIRRLADKVRLGREKSLLLRLSSGGGHDKQLAHGHVLRATHYALEHIYLGNVFFWSILNNYFGFTDLEKTQFSFKRPRFSSAENSCCEIFKSQPSAPVIKQLSNNLVFFLNTIQHAYCISLQKSHILCYT